ncbi:hypothetical protein AX16_005778 [Volvariella volvacea WC 439]|nr:hypothetical protein AX16_005778 [Volvariella volvacea WC 439]
MLLTWVIVPFLFFGAFARFVHREGCGGHRRGSECCIWYEILDDIQAHLFDGGECGEDAHEALRLTFHDAFAYSPRHHVYGGADGSVMAHESEQHHAANEGVRDIIHAERPYALKYGVSFGDMIQFAGAVGASNCLGGPRIPFFSGRANYSHAAPEGLLPSPFDSPDKIIGRMRDAGFSPRELVALLASHSVGAQETVDPNKAGAPLDSTPGAFDGQFFLETMTKTSPDGVFRLQSDHALARDSRTICAWQAFINDHASMVSEFETVMTKLSLLGQDKSSLTDCSDVIPVPRAHGHREHDHHLKPVAFQHGDSYEDVEEWCPDMELPKIAPGHPPRAKIPPVPKS